MTEMTFDKMIGQMTPSIYASLKEAVALGKWPDGRRLSTEQVNLCLEAVMRYEVENNVPEEARVGYLRRRTCGGGNDGSGVSPEMAGLATDATRGR
ncbi:YeaC family protein [Halomonas cibimaris]|uniref:YeaC family protein n=1 Tax=Halomonas cibimaris TaxID=657012 RepID=A0ABP7LUA8_9GAMM